MVMSSLSHWSFIGLTKASAMTFNGRRNFRSTEQRAPLPRQNRALGGLMVRLFFVMGVRMEGMQYVFYIFPGRNFSKASFFLEQVFLTMKKAHGMPEECPNEPLNQHGEHWPHQVWDIYTPTSGAIIRIRGLMVFIYINDYTDGYVNGVRIVTFHIFPYCSHVRKI